VSVSPAGFVVAAVAALLLGYLVPALVRRRQAVGDARVPDRFSTRLRVVERRSTPVSGGASTEALVRSTIRSAPHQIAERREEQAVNRPAGMAERRTAAEARRVAAVRAALAARRAEQAAAARRRLVLTLVVLGVTVIAWVAVAVASFQWYLALFPTVVLGATLYLGVRAAQAERAEWSQVPESLRAPRAATPSGPSYSPSQLRAHLTATGAAPEGVDARSGLRWDTGEMPLDVASVAEDVEAVAEQAPEADAAGTWTPVPVPVPTYTLKAAAPRRETEVTAEPSAVEIASSDDAGVVVAEVEETSATDVPSIDLNAVLARRRAV